MPRRSLLLLAPLVLYDAHYAKTDPARRQLNERAQLGGVALNPTIEVEYLATALALAADGFGDTIACRASVVSEVAPEASTSYRSPSRCTTHLHW